MKSKVRNAAEPPELLRKRLKRRLKSSGKRSSIVRYFLAQDRHYSVEELYREIKKADPGVSYSTVYRTLRLLAECNIAAAKRFQGKEVRYEPVHEKEHHDHLVCTACGRISEFHHAGIEELQRGIAKKHDFQVTYHELALYGICGKCRNKEH
jgi:Fur family ferric uptake transcriptional regulator